MKNNRLLNIFLLILSLSCALQTQARDTNETAEADSRPASSVLFERDRGEDGEPRHDRGHDPSENGRGPNSPRPDSPAPRENDEPRHDRGHDPSDNGRGPNSPPPHTPEPTPHRPDPTPHRPDPTPHRPEPTPHYPPPRDHDEPVHDRGHDPSDNGRGPNSPPPAWPTDPYPDRPHRPDPYPSYPEPEPTPYYPEPTPSYPEPSYPEPSYPEPIYPAPSYPEPTPAPPAPAPGHNWQTRTISIPVERLVSNESLDLTQLARLFNFRNWQVVNIRAVTKPKGTTPATAYLMADDEVIALQKNLGRQINLTPEVQTMMDGSFRTLKLHIKGSTTIIDSIEIEMGTYFN